MGRASRVLLVLLLGAALSTLAWWQFRTRPDSTDSPQVLRVGYAVEAPYAFVDATRRVTGEGPETARLVAQRLGVKLEWQQIEFGSLIRELNAHHIDLVAAGLFITPERQSQVAFSLPKFRARAALLVANGNPLALHSYDDIIRRRAKVAALSRSVEERELRDTAHAAPEQLVTVSDALSGVLAVRNGQADAFALSVHSLRWIVDRSPDNRVELAEPFDPPASLAEGWLGAFAFPKDRDAVRDRWNRQLRQVLGGEAHLAAVRPFGFSAADVPTPAP